MNGNTIARKIAKLKKKSMGWFASACKNIKWILGFDEEDRSDEDQSAVMATPFVNTKER